MRDFPTNPTEKVIRNFRQIPLWPLQLMPIREDALIQKHWERLQTPDKDNLWRELGDEFTGDPSLFQDRPIVNSLLFCLVHSWHWDSSL